MSEVGNIMFESHEVVRWRVRDLVRSVKETLPDFFESPGTEGASFTLSSKDILTVVAQLNDEFTYSSTHTEAVTDMMCEHVGRIMVPMLATAFEKVRILYEDDESDVPASTWLDADIIWDSLLPQLSGDLGQVNRIAAQVVKAKLNAAILRDEASWAAMAEELTTNLEDVFELFHGVVALNLIMIYVNVILLDRYPLLNVSTYED